MAEQYGVGVMTIQRALRELQNDRMTYSIAGRGTFVHPDIVDARDDAHMRKAMADPERVKQIAHYLAQQHKILKRHDDATGRRDRDTAIRDLLEHTQNHRELISQIAELIPGPNVGVDRSPQRMPAHVPPPPHPPQQN